MIFYYGCNFLRAAAQIVLVLQLAKGMYIPRVNGKWFYIGQPLAAGSAVLLEWNEMILGNVHLSNSKMIVIGFCLFFLLCSVVLLMLLWVKSIKYKRAEGMKQIMQMKIEMLEKNFHILQAEYQERTAIVHDMKNHLRAIGGMVEKGHTKEAMAYISEITGKLWHGEAIVWSNHETVDLILNMKFQEAQNENIEVNCKCENMGDLTLSFVEICALFSNLLDNAIEANRRCSMERKIGIVCVRREDMLIISVSNPVEKGMGGKENPWLITTKPDKKAHGFGIPSIQNVLAAHSGYMRTEVKNNTFCIITYMQAFKK